VGTRTVVSGTVSAAFIVECAIDFTRATFRLQVTTQAGLNFQIRREGDTEWQQCLQLPGATFKHKVFFAMASFSGAGKSNWNYIHSIRFYDQEDIIKTDEPTNHQVFKAGASDLLHESNQDLSLDRN
jgi:hypothetical protein